MYMQQSWMLHKFTLISMINGQLLKVRRSHRENDAKAEIELTSPRSRCLSAPNCETRSYICVLFAKIRLSQWRRLSSGLRDKTFGKFIRYLVSFILMCRRRQYPLVTNKKSPSEIFSTASERNNKQVDVTGYWWRLQITPRTPYPLTFEKFRGRLLVAKICELRTLIWNSSCCGFPDFL